MEDINLYKDIILKFEEERKIKEKNIEEDYNGSINSICDNLYSIIFNPKLKSIIKFDNDTVINDDKIKIVEDNYLLYRRFSYIIKQQKFILEFNSLNLDRIFKNHMHYKYTFIYDLSNEFNKRYKTIKIQIYRFDICEERGYDSTSLESIPNLYRYRIILNHLSDEDKYMKLEKERKLEKEWKEKHPILSLFVNYHFK